MNSNKNTSKVKPLINIIGDVKNPDGSTTVEYELNTGALEVCAREYEKDISQLTPDEIHSFAEKNVRWALKCHNGWKIIKKAIAN
jgi:hypothetical protein